MKLLSWKTPYEMLFHKQPNYQTLQIFGCLCYATNTQPRKDKLAPQTNPCVFIGFKCGFKAFKLYDLVQNKIIMARDVTFHESKFSFLSAGVHPDFCSPPLPISTDMQDDFGTVSASSTTTPKQADTPSSSSGIDHSISLIRCNDIIKRPPS